MKKLFLAIVLFSMMLSFISCSDNINKLKETTGVVTDIEGNGNLLSVAKILVDGDTAIFKLSDARFINGIFMVGDSVSISYVKGNKDTLRALVVNLVPQTPHYFDAESAKGDTLITAPIHSDIVSSGADPLSSN